MVDKRNPKNQFEFFYNEEGMNEVSSQIMNAYNSGVIDQPNGDFNLNAQSVNEGKLQ